MKFSSILILLPLLLQLLPYTSSSTNPHRISTSSNQAVIQSWEFLSSTEGWASAVPTEMQMSVAHDPGRGELRCAIEGPNPSFNSPNLQIDLFNTATSNDDFEDHITLALRYKSTGPSTQGKVVLLTSSSPSSSFTKHFPVLNDGKWHETYAAFQLSDFTVLSSTVTGITIHPVTHRLRDETPAIHIPPSPSPKSGNSFSIDWIRLVNSPVITRVTGCDGMEHSDTNVFDSNTIVYDVTEVTENVNTHLSHFSTVWNTRDVNYARSYNCRRTGGELLTLSGRYLGVGGVNGIGKPLIVYIGDERCLDVTHVDGSQDTVTCITPAMNIDVDDDSNVIQDVIVQHGLLTGLNFTAPSYLAYALPPPQVSELFITNVGSNSLDVNWVVGGSVKERLTYTGFIVNWRLASNAVTLGNVWPGEVVVGNVTTTTITNVVQNSLYVVRIRGVNDNQDTSEWESLDKYGRRQLIQGGLVGGSVEVIVHTLAYDFEFTHFNSNLTMNHSGHFDPRSLGPTGVVGSEGHYGLYLLGSANVENCNASVVCCDLYSDVNGNAQCISDNSISCAATKTENSDLINGVTQNQFIPSNIVPNEEKFIRPFNTMAPKIPTVRCGPALRLTASKPRLAGSAWYAREVEVGEGFDTSFKIRISNPSLRCNSMDDVYGYCRSRGGDGMAFVIQSEGSRALGAAGGGLGYEGVNNSIAIEFDTYYNSDKTEPYENHVSVHSRGYRNPNNADQGYSLGHTTDVPDLTDGVISIRIVYKPDFDERFITNKNFVPSPYITEFLTNGDYSTGGMGMLYVYVNNLLDPALIVPLNLEGLLELNHGRGFVGFTAATGESTWQVHDVMEWKFRSLREDWITGVVKETVVNEV